MKLESFLLNVAILFAGPLSGQDFEIRANKSDAEKVVIANKQVTGFFSEKVGSIFAKCITAGNDEADFELLEGDLVISSFKGKENAKELKPADGSDLRDKKLKIRKKGTTTALTEFIFNQKPEFEVRVKQEDQALKINTDGEAQYDQSGKISSLFITCVSPIDAGTKYQVFIADNLSVEIPADGKPHEVKSTTITNLSGEQITIKNANGVSLSTFQAKSKEGNAEVTGKGIGAISDLKPVVEEVKAKFKNLSSTVYGLQVPSGNPNTGYTGSKYVHIFLDQFGNNLFSTIPQGVANRQYVVHVFYIEDATNSHFVNYSINQTAGEFQEALVFNNAGQLSSVEFRSGTDPGKSSNFRWAHKEFLLSTSTTNIVFDVVRTALKNQDLVKSEFDNQVLKTYTIKMSKVYHGSFDVGLINSTLENPDFELVESPANAADKVVKRNDGSNRGVITAMATFYTSPIIILEDLLGIKEIPNYMKSGRNFLEDHKIYERIYPTVGVGFTDRTLENLFFGFNWEFARGGSIFLGRHYGKVNVYEAPANFVFKETVVSEAEFNLQKNTGWKTNWAVGLNLDILIIRNLFRPAGAATGGND